MTINRNQRAWLGGFVAPALAGIFMASCGASDGVGMGSGGTGTIGTGGSVNPGTGGNVNPGTGGGGTPGTGGGGMPGTGGSANPGTGGRANPGTGGSANPGTGGSANPGTGGSANPGTGGGGTPGTGGSGTPGTGGRGIGGRGGSAGRGGITGTAGTPGTGGRGGATTGMGGAGSCPHLQMKGTDFCTIGDSWLAIPGSQVTTLENHLKTAGVIPAGDHFDRREVSGTTLSAIVRTYTNKPANCKVIIMDGGGIDLFTTPLDPNSSAVTSIVNMYKDFLQKLKTDGYTQHVIYSLYPVIPSTMNLNANMKPGFSAACAASAVDCHLVDLEPLFMGQHFASDRTHPDAAGATLIGDAWWKAMQDNCIAQ